MNNRQLLITLSLTLFLALPALAQRKKAAPAEIVPKATLAAERWQGYQQRLALQQNSLVKNIPFRNVGPTVMSGRVDDIEVDPSDPTHFYVAYASGGLWETKNNGISFTPMFQNEIVMSIGDIAVDWGTGTIYVGSGENNSSRSSYSGYGIFKSTDNGKTWIHLGLEESHHIGRIVLHPTNPNTFWVAALGHLYSDNAERGVYKTTDGGKTYTKTLFSNDKSGAIELAKDPSNADILYAALWQKDRKAWNFDGAGEGSGLYKSTDGGSNWTKINTEASGFPTTKGVGRIGLEVSVSNPSIVYAMLDNQDFRDKKEKKDEEEKVTKDLLRSISKADFLALNNKDINAYLDANRFPQKYNAPDIKKDVEAGKVKPLDLVEYTEDANSLLFDTEVKGGEMYRSNDGGKTWFKTHAGYIEDLVYSYGYYFGQVRIDARDPDHIYTMGVPIVRSLDGGKTWESIDNDNVHSDHHALWVNPNRTGHLILGNDGGINISYDDGKTWNKCNPIPLGQFYSVTYDMASPYNVYGGLQDNGVWMGPSNYEYSNGWQAEGQYPYKSIFGGDGMQVQVDFRDNLTYYTGLQFGNYVRGNSQTGDRKRITPSHELGERPYRWNWETPIFLSRHNQDVLYMGSNRFHRSMDKGDNFETLSGDLTAGGKKGNVSYGTLTVIAESPTRFGLLYTGSDDGLIHVSKDGGYSWTKIVSGLPQNYWVSNVESSKHKESRVYASLNGYRWDNFDALVYVSEDYGATWKKIGSNLPKESVNIIREDPENENVLYVGTDHGLYVSVDKGNSFMAFDGGLPNVAVHDLAIHPREKELIVGTHGRSIYIGNVAHLQMLTGEVLAKALHLFDTDKVTHSERWGMPGYSQWRPVNEPSQTLPFYAKAGGDVALTLTSDKGTKVYETTIKADKGLNYYGYDLTVTDAHVDALKAELGEEKAKAVKKADNGKTYLVPGTYTVTISQGGETSTTKLKVDEPRKRPERKG
ncbi:MULTISPECIES: sialidase family protein [unclassified Imperialibacter]|uniref:WD40/YVTN/BNR-like repeat-containing protein n=1 Tax=unclassified Imperialibacter TaxID=2629706 RepID=UPI00125449D0|nr:MULTISPECIES: sialidase family protein [unclassified Imperialibacter]CAD5250577.1 Glycosyl hydrolase [Imperialibacter sp. 75]CAD5286498.1 Glycosyl hydrolase [Imperialibacter sp. 89]VVT05598.1 Glycosyl hydrolase [Imperialibacter sp. EC-SDR9]